MGVKVVQMQRRDACELPFHHRNAPGDRYLALDSGVLAGCPMYIAVRSVSAVDPAQGEYVDTHTHSVDSAYLFCGAGAGMEGLAAIVRVGGEEERVESPAAVFIPRGSPHSYKLVAGRGLFVNVVLSGDYRAHTSG